MKQPQVRMRIEANKVGKFLDEPNRIAELIDYEIWARGHPKLAQGRGTRQHIAVTVATILIDLLETKPCQKSTATQENH